MTHATYDVSIILQHNSLQNVQCDSNSTFDSGSSILFFISIAVTAERSLQMSLRQSRNRRFGTIEERWARLDLRPNTRKKSVSVENVL
jgi:hypothetical protein